MRPIPAEDELPSTVRRSSDKAQRTWAKAHDSAVETYGEGERAHRTAYAALKHTHQKVGDHWEAKDEPGPSDERAARGASRGGAEPGGDTAGGVDAGASRDELYEQARRLDISGRSTMSKDALVDALRQESEQRNREAREPDDQ